MESTISITSKWQIHIPKSIRKSLKMTKPVQAFIQVKQGRIVITPRPSKVLGLAGKYAKYTKDKKIDLDNIRDYIDYSKT